MSEDETTQHEHVDQQSKGQAEQQQQKPPGSQDESATRTCPTCGWMFPTVAALREHACGRRLQRKPRPKPRSMSGDLAAVARCVYTHNPFYVVSAALFLYGIRLMFTTRDPTLYGWTLLGILAGYSLLLVLSAVLIVRLGRVWDDARTIILSVVVLLVVMAGSFDQLIIEQRSLSKPLLVTGLAIAVALSEGLMRGAGIRMALLYRGAYHLILGFFFLHPLAFLKLLHEYPGEGEVPVSWGLFFFPMAGAVVFLSLIPAIRAGAWYAENNGTPWRWPAFPGVLFGLLAALICARSYWLTITCYPADALTSPWAPYFLSPFLVALAVLLLEMGLVSGSRKAIAGALLLPAVALVAAFPAWVHTGLQRQFLILITDGLASPLFLALVVITGFYIYAWLRRVGAAEIGVVMALLALSVVGPSTLGFSQPASPEAWPVVCVALLLLAQLYRHRSPLRALLAAVAAALVAAVLLEDTWFMAGHGAIPGHLLIAVGLAIGLVWHDRVARLIQGAALLTLAGAVVTARFAGPWLVPDLPNWGWWVYWAGAAALTFAYWLATRRDLALYVFFLQLTAHLIYWMGILYRLLGRPDRPQGSLALFWGSVSFLLALLISLAKGGQLRDLVRWMKRAGRRGPPHLCAR